MKFHFRKFIRTHSDTGIEIEVTLALNLTFSPGERNSVRMSLAYECPFLEIQSREFQ